jgi:hypothetical protein
MIDPNGPAYPVDVPAGASITIPHVCNGLTIRAYFAGLAMQGQAANPAIYTTWAARRYGEAPLKVTQEQWLEAQHEFSRGLIASSLIAADRMIAALNGSAAP